MKKIFSDETHSIKMISSFLLVFPLDDGDADGFILIVLKLIVLFLGCLHSDCVDFGLFLWVVFIWVVLIVIVLMLIVLKLIVGFTSFPVG